MKVEYLHWRCPKCNSKVSFGLDIATLFDEDEHEAYFDPLSGVPFYILTCDNQKCNATWNFGVSNMYESSI